jgi:type II secretory pathway component PulF
MLLLLIGGGMLWIGFASNSMPQLSDWQAQLSVSLAYYGKVITSALSWIPNWAGALIFLVLLGGLAWYALRQIGGRTDSDKAVADAPELKEAAETEETHPLQEEPVEY